MPIYSHTPANSLEEIGIYTYDDTLPLVDVFTNIAKNTKCKSCISHKESKNELESYFREVLPEYDEDRVYISDIKKVFQWYNSLYEAGLVQLPKEENTKKKCAPFFSPKRNNGFPSFENSFNLLFKDKSIFMAAA